MSISKEKVNEWRQSFKAVYRESQHSELDALCDAALSQTAPSAQEGVREAAEHAVRLLQQAADCGVQSADDSRAFQRGADALQSALSATPSASALGEWRPIETAPKDGTRVLGCDADGVRDRFWWAEGAGWLRLGGRLYTPVAWMPLPAALADTAGKKGE